MTGEGRPSGRRAMAAYDKVATTGPGQELPLAVGQEGEVHSPGGGDLMRPRGRGKAGKGRGYRIRGSRRGIPGGTRRALGR